MKITTKLVVKLIIRFIARNDKKRDKMLINNRNTNKNYQFDIPYILDDKKEHLFDFYKQNKDDNNLTCIDIHGGGYIYSYKENNFFINDFYANNGINVISTNYTLFNGEINIKHTIKEMACLLKYLYLNNDNYHIDFNNLILKGDSAGGHIAFLLALTINNKSLQKYYDVDIDENIKVKKLILNSPVYDYFMIYNLAKKVLTKNALKLFFGNNLDDEFIQNNNPSYLIINKSINVDFSIFVTTSRNDFLKNHSLKLKSELFDKVILDFNYSFDKKINHIYNVYNPYDKRSLLTNQKIIDYLKNNN